MSIEKKCVDCSIIIVDEWFFACKGFMCDKVLHYNCAAGKSKKLLSKFPNDVKKGMRLLFDDVPGLSWFCSDCLVRMKELHSYVIKRVEPGEDAQIKTKPAVSTTPKIMEYSRVTRSQTKCQDQPPIIARTTQAISNSGDNLIPDVSLVPIASDTDTPPFTETIITSIPTFRTNHPHNHKDSSTISNISNDNAIQTDAEVIKVVAPRRWLFVSRIDKAISNQQFENFIKLRMQLDKAVCIKISPNRQNGQVYDHTSFRVSLPENQFQIALQSSNWPTGLLVKEFQWRPRNQNFRNVTVDRTCQ